MNRREPFLTAVVAGAVLAIALPLFWGRPAPDLAPTWIAGVFAAAGDWAAVYPDPGAYFTVTTPPEWGAASRETGGPGLVFAYIYPPLWAALVAPLTKVVGLAAFQKAVLVLNHLAFLGTILLARRIAAPDLPSSLYLLFGVVLLASGPFAPLALFQNQPQIIVGFLSLLAIERLRPAPFAAGAALGLATALKVAPILILPALLAAGDTRRVGLGFLAVGGGLGLLSLALAGWAPHAAYLSLLKTISGTAILSEYAYTLDALFAQFGPLDTMDWIGFGEAATQGWWAGAKSPPWRLASAAILLAAVLGTTLAARRGAGPLFWPAALIALGLAGSVAWSFYFLAPLTFLPALAARLGPWRGTIAAILLALPGSYLVLPLARDSAVLPFADQALGVATLAATALVFAFLARRPDRPLHARGPRV